MKFTIPANTFRAAASVAAKNDTRYYLCGFYVDTVASKLVATDGHRLISIPFTAEETESLKSTIYALPPTTAPKNGTVTIDASAKAAEITYTDARGNNVGRHVVDVVDGTFPDYQAVMPTDMGGTPEFLCFNPKCLADVTKDVPKGSSIKIRFAQNEPEESPMLVTVNTSEFEDVLYVLMPMRT